MKRTWKWLKYENWDPFVMFVSLFIFNKNQNSLQIYYSVQLYTNQKFDWFQRKITQFLNYNAIFSDFSDIKAARRILDVDGNRHTFHVTGKLRMSTGSWGYKYRWLWLTSAHLPTVMASCTILVACFVALCVIQVNIYQVKLRSLFYNS